MWRNILYWRSWRREGGTYTWSSFTRLPAGENTVLPVVPRKDSGYLSSYMWVSLPSSGLTGLTTMAKGKTGKVLLLGAGWSQSHRGLATWYNLHCSVTQTQRAILPYPFISKGIYVKYIFKYLFNIYWTILTISKYNSMAPRACLLPCNP